MANVVRYLTGWEHGITPVTTGGGLARGLTLTPTVGAQYARTSGYGIQVNPVAQADESLDCPLFTGQAVTAASIWCRPVTLDTSSSYNVFYIMSNVAGPQYACIGVDTSNNWVIRDGNALQIKQTGLPVVLGTWTLLELLVDMTANPWVIKWRVNGVDQPSTTMAIASSTSKGVGLGAFAPGNRTVEFWFDDLVVIDGTDQTMFPIGPYVVEGITADQTAAAEHQGTLAGWDYTDDFSGFTSISSTSETSSRSRVDDLNTTDGVRAGSASMTGNLRWPVADTVSNGTPRGVALVTSSEEQTTGVNNATFRTYVSGNTTNHFNGDPAWGAAWTYLVSVMDVNPASTAWTLADVQAIRFEFLSTDGSPSVYLGGFVYEVAFPISQGTKLHPSSDITVGDWAPSGGGTLASNVDETPYSDADYISGTNTVEVKFT